MEATEQIHSAQFLDYQLQEIISLLEKQSIERTLVQRGPSINHELIAAMLQNQHQARLQEKLVQLHPADCAFILESLPLDERQIVWDVIKSHHDGQILLEVSDAVRQTLISGMAAEELATVAGKLNTDEIADLAANLPKRTMLKILRSLNSEDRQHLNNILSYQETQVGALMDFGMIK